ncbi:MAG: restriction endonuclease [Syntrophomonas sp.]
MILDSKREKQKRVAAIRISDIDNMSGLEFERYIKNSLDNQGYKTSLTNASGDLGADIIASYGDVRYSVQVKRYSSAVDRKAVSDAVGAKYHYKCNQAMVITNNYFSPGAKELAKSTGCTLILIEIY